MSTFRKSERIYRSGSQTLPGRFYTSSDIFQQEYERIFGRLWLCIGRSGEVAQPGDYFLIEHGPESVIVVRDGQGTARAFHNVCRHRGTRLCEQPRGVFRQTIQCTYHAWTYGLDGSLIAAPDTQGLDGFDKARHSLSPVHLKEWGGFLFINLAEDPPSFSEIFTPLMQRFARYHFPELRAVRRITYDVRANWKLIFLNFSECLHCPVIHPELANLSPYRSGENDLVEGPILGGFMTILRDGGSMTMSGGVAGLPVGDLTEQDRRRVYYYSVFPNMLLSPHPDYVMYHTVWPVDPGRTRVTCEWLFQPKAADRAPEYDPEDAIKFWDTTNRQDWHVCELSQLGIASRGYAPGPYTTRESLLASWDEEYLRQLGHRRSD